MPTTVPAMAPGLWAKDRPSRPDDAFGTRVAEGTTVTIVCVVPSPVEVDVRVTMIVDVWNPEGAVENLVVDGSPGTPIGARELELDGSGIDDDDDDVTIVVDTGSEVVERDMDETGFVDDIGNDVGGGGREEGGVDVGGIDDGGVEEGGTEEGGLEEGDTVDTGIDDGELDADDVEDERVDDSNVDENVDDEDALVLTKFSSAFRLGHTRKITDDCEELD
jgi:hypothetical protein